MVARVSRKREAASPAAQLRAGTNASSRPRYQPACLWSRRCPAIPLHRKVAKPFLAPPMAQGLKPNGSQNPASRGFLAEVASEGPPGQQASYLLGRCFAQRRFILRASTLRRSGIVSSCILLLAVSAISLRATTQERRDPQPTRVEYTVASAASATAEAGAVVGGVVGVPARPRRVGQLPETLTLVVVGTMLIGLAAAVRRTT